MLGPTTTTPGTVCNCEPLEGATKTYFVWSSSSNEKREIDDVIDIYVTGEAVVFEKRSHEAITVPRNDIYFVTCERCSSPPCV